MRKDPKIINGSRRTRIAAGSGVTVTEVNQLVDRFFEAQKMMKSLGSGGGMPGMPGLPGAKKRQQQKQPKKKKGTQRLGKPGAVKEKAPRIPGSGAGGVLEGLDLSQLPEGFTLDDRREYGAAALHFITLSHRPAAV